jgi:two-component system, NtrC family, sensor kinase
MRSIPICIFSSNHMKILITSFIALLLASLSYAQENLPPAYQIQTDTLEYFELDHDFWQVLNDPKATYTINQITQPALSAQFHHLQTGTNHPDNFSSTHWLKYQLKNTMNRRAEIAFSTGSDQSDYYLFRKDSAMAHFITGRTVPWEKRDGLKKATAIPFSLAPGETGTVIQRRFNHNPDSLSAETRIRLYATKKLEDAALKEYEIDYVQETHLYTSFIAGLLLLAGIFNFLLFWQLKERTNLYFSLVLICFFFLYFPFFRAVLGRDKPVLADFFNTIGACFIVFILFFVREYFQIYNKYKRWDKFLVITSYAMFVLFFINFVPLPEATKKLFFNFRRFGLIAYLVAIAITIIISIVKPSEKRKIFIVAVLPFIGSLFLGIIVFTILSMVFKQFNFAQWDKWLLYFLGICMVWPTIVFTAFLFKDYGRQQRQLVEGLLEKERFAKEKEQEKASYMEQVKLDLEQQVTQRTSELKTSLNELKATQAQLIQSEKMASLGELTAGIAHEIQNPLNFVNNFSEVSTELLHEMTEELSKGKLADAKEIADSLKQNLEKINHHGKRAGDIVKGMLQHSRSSNGQKEPTDINALADEYLRLAYHGFRSKDKSFNTTLKTDYDETIGYINIIPQDIGRVLLNLITNAAYAVGEKNKSGIENYEPTLSVTTKKLGDRVLISVKDNGNGIQQQLLDKIFQPFFTTKPSGQGTGLGLSLSYDIVKAHGGELKVETREGESTAFMVSIPI